MPLYLVRWPGVEVSLIKAESPMELFWTIDAEDDPFECTYEVYKGPVNIKFEPKTPPVFEKTSKDCIATPDCKAELASNFKSLINEDEYTDVVLQAEGKQIKCHKAILVRRSGYFRDAFHSEMSEPPSNIVQLNHMSFDTLKAVIEFLYSGEFSIPEHGASSQKDQRASDPLAIMEALLASVVDPKPTISKKTSKGNENASNMVTSSIIWPSGYKDTSDLQMCFWIKVLMAAHHFSLDSLLKVVMRQIVKRLETEIRCEHTLQVYRIAYGLQLFGLEKVCAHIIARGFYEIDHDCFYSELPRNLQTEVVKLAREVYKKAMAGNCKEDMQLLAAVLKRTRNLNEIQQLINSGASGKAINAVNYIIQNTDWDRPESFQNGLEVIKYLLNNGCNINDIDIIGNTPLHLAASEINTKLVRELLKLGANPHILDHDGLKAVDVGRRDRNSNDSYSLIVGVTDATAVKARRQKAENTLAQQVGMLEVAMTKVKDLKMQASNRVDLMQSATFQVNEEFSKELYQGAGEEVGPLEWQLAKIDDFDQTGENLVKFAFPSLFKYMKKVEAAGDTVDEEAAAEGFQQKVKLALVQDVHPTFSSKGSGKSFRNLSGSAELLDSDDEMGDFGGFSSDYSL